MTNREPRPHSTAAAEVTLTLDDGEVYVREDGARDAPALLLIHGNASSSRWWDEMVPLLTAPHRVIRIDLLGYGRPAKPADASYALADQARRAGAAMDRLGVERVIAVGHSSGAAATALAERRPGLVTALVLINTGPHLGACTVPPVALDPSPWPDVSDGVLRQITSAAFSRPGYQIPAKLLSSPTASGSAASSPRPIARARSPAPGLSADAGGGVRRSAATRLPGDSGPDNDRAERPGASRGS